jgi:hypothetical protein
MYVLRSDILISNILRIVLPLTRRRSAQIRVHVPRAQAGRADASPNFSTHFFAATISPHTTHPITWLLWLCWLLSGSLSRTSVHEYMGTPKIFS